MAMCPKCGKEISYVVEIVEAEVVTNIFQEDDNIVSITPLDDFEKNLKYLCPKCGKNLFDLLCEAREFLQGRV